MLKLLGITAIRRGRDGMNPQSPYYANYDESKANPFPNLPDPLRLKNGQRVTTAEGWWKHRRPEIVEDFDREIYGRVPWETPKVNWEVTSTKRETNGQVPVVTKQLVGQVDNSACPLISVNLQLTLSTPADASGPVPVIMQFGFNFGSGRFRGTNAPATNTFAPRAFGGAGERADLAAAGAGQRLGLRRFHACQRSSRQRRRPPARHHRPVQQRPAAEGGRLGGIARLGLGREPGAGLSGNRQSGGC